MWKQIIEKINHLKNLDKQLQVFGAEAHRYEFWPTATEQEVKAIENKYDIEIPNDLKYFYTNIGNGIVGGYYGLVSIASITGFRPNESYPGIDVIKEMAMEYDSEGFEEDYFEIPHRMLTGLISIIHEGCGHRICLVTNGEKVGKIVQVSADGFIYETENTLMDIYNKWFDKEINIFREVKLLMEKGNTYSQINEQMRTNYNIFDVGDIIVSITNVKKPGAIFGEGGHKIYHGAIQIPWYENILENWQKQNLIK